MMKSLTAIAVMVTILAGATPAQAQGTDASSSNPRPESGGPPPPPPGHGDGPRPHGPPPEAIAACKGLAASAACSFVAPRGDTIRGTCRKVPEGMMACAPAHMPPHEGMNGPGGMPPPDANGASPGGTGPNR